MTPTAMFDTVHHDLLIPSLERMVALVGIALNWVWSYSTSCIVPSQLVL